MVPCLQSVHQHVAGSHQVNRDQTESSQVKDTVDSDIVAANSWLAKHKAYKL